MKRVISASGIKKEGKIMLRVSPISSNFKKLTNSAQKIETTKVEIGDNSPRSPTQTRVK